MIWALAIIFALMTGAHFGWNAYPRTDTELICDGIVFLLIALAWKKL